MSDNSNDIIVQMRDAYIRDLHDRLTKGVPTGEFKEDESGGSVEIRRPANAQELKRIFEVLETHGVMTARKSIDALHEAAQAKVKSGTLRLGNRVIQTDPEDKSTNGENFTAQA